MNDPNKKDHVQRICSLEVQNKYLIAEIVEFRGCVGRMRPGYRLYFRDMSLLDGEIGDPWCPYLK